MPQFYSFSVYNSVMFSHFRNYAAMAVISFSSPQEIPQVLIGNSTPSPSPDNNNPLAGSATDLPFLHISSK